MLEVPVSTAAQDEEAWAPELEVLGVQPLSSSGNGEPYARDLHNDSMHRTASGSLGSNELHHNVRTLTSAAAV